MPQPCIIVQWYTFLFCISIAIDYWGPCPNDQNFRSCGTWHSIIPGQTHQGPQKFKINWDHAGAEDIQGSSSHPGCPTWRHRGKQSTQNLRYHHLQLASAFIRQAKWMRPKLVPYATYIWYWYDTPPIARTNPRPNQWRGDALKEPPLRHGIEIAAQRRKKSGERVS